jgi:hypothetical protein
VKPGSGGTNLAIVQEGIRAAMKRFLIFAILGPPLGDGSKGTKALASKTSGAGQATVRGARLNFAGGKFR